MPYKTRFAPSPSNDLHIGNVRTAYFNWLAARATSGQFYLRIDDTDLQRSKSEYIGAIVDAMNWLGLSYDKMVQQSGRFSVYRDKAEKLISEGLAEVISGGAIALKLPESHPMPVSWHDEIAGDINVSSTDISESRDIVLMKSDGSPTYNWSSVVDDAEMEINYIIRGTDHITNTAKQVLLFGLIDAPLPKFAHVGLITSDNKPLSKRDNASSMTYYRTSCYDPDAVLNFLGRMGWGPTVDDKTTALLPRERMLELFFSGGKMKSAPSKFDLAKLNSFDRKYKGRKKLS